MPSRRWSSRGDDRVAAQNGGVGINRDVVLDGRMALFARQLETGAGGQCAERDALINFDVVADCWLSHR